MVKQNRAVLSEPEFIDNLRRRIVLPRSSGVVLGIGDDCAIFRPRGASEDMHRYAEQVGLDVPKFDQCVSTGAHRAGVQRDMEEGSRLGVTGTPAFFVNGRPLQAAQPLDTFVRVIEEELRGR